MNSAFALDEEAEEDDEFEENPEDKNSEKTEKLDSENLISFFNRWDILVGLIPPAVMFIEWMLCEYILRVNSVGLSIMKKYPGNQFKVF